MATKPHDAAVERLTNLSFALHGAANTGGNPDRSAAWIRTHVDGYQGKTDEAFEKALRRDVHTLQRAGVPITHSNDGTGATYRMQPDEYQLPAVEFTPEEAMVLGVAGGMGQPGGLGDFSKSGWTKIAASGASRDLAGAPVFTTFDDSARVAPEVITAIITAVRAKVRIRFDYRPRPDAELQRRTMDPWGLVNNSMRLYLVGWDVDREAPRVFRLLRVANVKRSRIEPSNLEPTEKLQDIVSRFLRSGQTVDATLVVPEGKAKELVDAGQRGEGGIVKLTGVSRDWLVRTAVGYAPDVRVLEPAEVIADIVTLLEQGGV